MDATGADAALIRVWDKKAHRYPIVSQRNFPDHYLKAVEAAPLGGAVRWVIAHGRPVIAPDISLEPRLSGKVQLQLGLRSCAMLPLKVHDEVRGVIHVASRTLGYFDAEQEDHLTAIARQMSIALENRELFFNLKASRDELERSNQVKSEFLSVMSHELRTPLNIIMGYTEVIKQDLSDRGDQAGQTALCKIDSQAKALLRMVDMIMTATRIESASIAVARESVDLARLFEELKAAYASPKDRPITLIWHLGDDLFEVNSDYEKLKQILQNLIDNAIKFTERGSVSITARLGQRRGLGEPQVEPNGEPIALGAQRVCEFAVADTGVGIPEENLPLIFDMFRQVDSSDTRAFEGVGLGLYIVKKYCELIGGEIHVESVVDQGSTFTVQLPLWRTEEGSAVLRTDADVSRIRLPSASN
jgi:signal transduction histidine kinase